MRASVAAAANAPEGEVGGCTALTIVPKLLLLARLEMGLAKFTWLNTLYALAPTVNASLSWKWNAFFRPRSALKNPGPRNEFRGIVPKVVTADPLANCDAEKQAVFTLAPPQDNGTAPTGWPSTVTF